MSSFQKERNSRGRDKLGLSSQKCNVTNHGFALKIISIVLKNNKSLVKPMSQKLNNGIDILVAKQFLST